MSPERHRLFTSSEERSCCATGRALMETIRAGAALTAGLLLTDLAVTDLWVRYFALTGWHSQDDLTSYLGGAIEWSPHEHNVAAQALNEYLDDHGMDHPVSYADEL